MLPDFSFHRALVPRVLTGINRNFPLDLTRNRLLSQLALERIRSTTAFRSSPIVRNYLSVVRDDKPSTS